MYLFSCTAQQSKSTCELNYEKAKDELKEYSKSSKADYLSKAQLFLDSSLSCNETRKRSIERKIQIYFMQKAYKQGAKFVSTLEISDFNFEYEKDMYKNYLAGLEYDKANDLKNRDSVFKESIKNIENYIDKKKFTTFNEDTLAFYNLYFTKSRIFESKIIINDIDALKQKFPNEKDAIDKMKEITIESMIH
jgi:hypothetical protein